ncbi:MAG: hypothetical protein ACR2LV_02395 [Solirubrobacteraceae bacterium]
MSVPAAELTVPAATGPRASTRVLARRLAGGRLYIALGAVALVIAAASLLVPSTPSYDPWSWLIWGREIVHLKLQTTGGPTWKPLPVIFTTVFAPFGKAAPDLWLVVARAGGLMAVAMVFKVATRITRQLTEPARSTALATRSPAPALLAGVIAAGSLAVSRGFAIGSALGYSEGLMTALVLIAVDRHLDGRRRQAFAVGFAAALDRPELWLFWGSYGLYLWWKDPAMRKLVLGLFALIPVLWFVPDLVGSGHLFHGISRAQQPRSNSPAFAKCPFCTEVAKHAWPTLLLRVKVPAGFAMLAAALGLWRSRRTWLRGAAKGEARGSWVGRAWQSGAHRARLALLGAGAAGLAWWGLIGVLTQAGFSGNDRYLVLGAALFAIAGGAGWGWAAQTLAGLFGAISQRGGPQAAAAPLRRFSRPIIAAAAASLAAVFMAVPPWIGAHIIDVQGTHRAEVDQALLRESMAAAVRKLGGPVKVLRCGTVMTEGFQVPMLAWTLGVHILQIEGAPDIVRDGVIVLGTPLPPAPNVIFQTRAQPHSPLLPRIQDWPSVHYRVVAHTRKFRVYSSCPGSLV